MKDFPFLFFDFFFASLIVPDTVPMVLLHFELRCFLETQKKVEPLYAPIKSSFALSDEQAAQAVAVATALLIRHCAKVLDPNVAFGIAVYGFIEGSKTAGGPPII